MNKIIVKYIYSNFILINSAIVYKLNKCKHEMFKIQIIKKIEKYKYRSVCVLFICFFCGLFKVGLLEYTFVNK